MEFGPDENQRLFDAALRGFLADRVTVDSRRAAAETGGDAALWRGLCGLGLAGLLVPEEHGGTGLGVFDAALAAEALGHAAAPTPFLGTAVLAPLALRLLGAKAQRDAWLPRLAGGEIRVAAAFGALAGTTGRCALRLEHGRLSGEVAGALEAAEATHALVALPREGMALVALDAAGVTVRPRRSVDRLRPLADLSFAAVPVEVLAGGDAGRVLDAGRVVLAAETLGAAQAMLGKAVAYAGERRQFGRAIGSFQAVKHACAEMAAALEPCRAFVWYAAHAQDRAEEEPEARMLAAHAKAHLDEVGREVARGATEVHGGMGFTELLGLPFWFKRILANRQLLGGPERCREEAAIAQGIAAA
ncbi:acyl-CoA dehydrogenase family protein [Crenalkalicoccus roseus]|uniref:acyl-CoA dehydrogenase family protein n=1 Tax=Crenalkalicoccus roseus TaxID=1485588 RepID=UPI0010811B17|nr:acyl-CoA dehydrogenase family protein [Crenalkalicoccus roseus]